MQNHIKQSISKNDIVIFMKGEPTYTGCGYSSRAVEVLNHYGVEYAYENVLQSEDLRKAVKAYSGVKTLPQIFMKGAYYGGSDDIVERHTKGDLESIFQQKNIAMHLDKARTNLVITTVSKDEVKSCGKATAPSRLRSKKVSKPSSVQAL